MPEVLILWTIVAARQLRRALRLRRPAHARHRGSLTVDAVLDNRWAETVDEIVEEYRTGEIPRIVEPAEWDEQLGVAFDRYTDEPAPFYEQLRSLEPAPLPEEITSFTLGWRKTPEGKWEVVDFAEATP